MEDNYERKRDLELPRLFARSLVLDKRIWFFGRKTDHPMYVRDRVKRPFWPPTVSADIQVRSRLAITRAARRVLG